MDTGYEIPALKFIAEVRVCKFFKCESEFTFFVVLTLKLAIFGFKMQFLCVLEVQKIVKTSQNLVINNFVETNIATNIYHDWWSWSLDHQPQNWPFLVSKFTYFPPAGPQCYKISSKSCMTLSKKQLICQYIPWLVIIGNSTATFKVIFGTPAPKLAIFSQKLYFFAP